MLPASAAVSLIHRYRDERLLFASLTQAFHPATRKPRALGTRLKSWAGPQYELTLPVGEPSTLKQKPNPDNKGFYWITTDCCLVLTPPFAFCAVTVIMFSPVGSAPVK
jgi:hypothetical protein